METLDLKKQLKWLYAPSARQVELVDVPAFNFLKIDGAIEPGAMPGASPSFQQAVGALYGAAYTLKFAHKQRKVDPLDYPVMALEGLWWVEDGHFDIRVGGNWKYTLMILTPEAVTQSAFGEALDALDRKKPNPANRRLRLEHYAEGRAVQVLHLGPYATEPATVDRLEAFAHEHGLRMAGLHHEIYLGDPLRADPAKLKTILRHPVEA